VNISALAGFDSLTDTRESIDRNSKAIDSNQSFEMQVKISADQNSTLIENLKKFTMYEITVTAYNSHGSSLPSQKMRSLTESYKVNKSPGIALPALPDIKECCQSKGIYHNRCVDKFCDPVRTSDISLPDLMICAPWASDSFSCLANGIDHSDCCSSRGLPPSCVQLCSGNITRVDYTQFRCIQYMDELSNCLLQGYGVLPGAPASFRVSNINPTFALLRWDAPKTLAKTVTSYNVRYRPTAFDEGESNSYKTINTKTIPFILQNLRCCLAQNEFTFEKLI
jgi:hypothetical protein